MSLLTRAAPAGRRLRPGEHPDWCAKGHRCGLGEHRAQPVILDVPGLGRVVLTRVQAVNGRQHAEITTRVTLAAGAERRHLQHVLAELEQHLQRLVGMGVGR